jgi:hypothetical protein
MGALSRHPLVKVFLRPFRVATPNYARGGSFPVKRELWDRVTFAAKLNSVEEAPDPLRDPMLAALHPHEAIELLIFGPSQRTIGKTDPASLMAILEHEWIIVTFGEHIGTQIYRCDFEDTLLLEMTDILLYGRLRVDFFRDNQIQSVAIYFNTVTSNIYEQAVQLLLNGMDKPNHLAFQEREDVRTTIEKLPLKFRNGVANYLPTGQRALEIIHSPAVLIRRFAIFRRELSPEVALVLTDKELLFISEEPVRSARNSYETGKYGYIVTHCPLSRIEAVCSMEEQFLDMIKVKIRGLTLSFCFSREKRAANNAFVESVSALLIQAKKYEG